MNQLNETLRAIRTTKTILTKELNNTTDEHQRQKIEHYIIGLEKEEELLLKQIGD